MWREIKAEKRAEDAEEVAIELAKNAGKYCCRGMATVGVHDHPASVPRAEARISDGGTTYENFEEWAKRNNLLVSDPHHDSATCERCAVLREKQKALDFPAPPSTFGQRVWDALSNMEAPRVEWIPRKVDVPIFADPMLSIEEREKQTNGWTTCGCTKHRMCTPCHKNAFPESYNED